MGWSLYLWGLSPTVCQVACWCTSGERRARPRPDVGDFWWLFIGENDGTHEVNIWDLQDKLVGFKCLNHGSLNVPIEHHPTIRYMVYHGYYKVMSNSPKMGHLPIPVNGPIFPENVVVEKLSLFWINAATPEQPSLVHSPAKWKSRAIAALFDSQ